VHDPFGNALVVEMRDFLAHDEIFEKRGTTGTGAQGVLVVGDLDALIGAQRFALCARAERLQTFRLGIRVAGAAGLCAGSLLLGRLRCGMGVS
jgi:hypothetical protein